MCSPSDFALVRGHRVAGCRSLYHHSQYALHSRAAIQKNATGLATTVGADALAALGIVADPPPGSDDLLLHMLHTLTGVARAAVCDHAAAANLHLPFTCLCLLHNDD